MRRTSISAGRPKGAKSFDPVVAKAFGAAVQQARVQRGVSQEALAGLVGIERAHVGKIERGEHLPTIVAVFKLARGLECEAHELVAWVNALLPDGHVDDLIAQTLFSRRIKQGLPKMRNGNSASQLTRSKT